MGTNTPEKIDRLVVKLVLPNDLTAEHAEKKTR
jgi:hypothetical protein